MRSALVAGLALACGAILVAACSDDEKAKADDEAYLKVICSGLDGYTDALNSKTKVDDIAQAIRDFAAELKKVEPPADLRTFHDQFVKYLEDAVADPTSLVTRKPPLPPDDVRRRLASKEANVPECKNPTFFGGGG